MAQKRALNANAVDSPLSGGVFDNIPSGIQDVTYHYFHGDEAAVKTNTLHDMTMYSKGFVINDMAAADRDIDAGEFNKLTALLRNPGDLYDWLYINCDRMINRSANPGAPYNSLCGSKGELLDGHKWEICSLVVQRVESLLTTPLHELDRLTAEEKYVRNCVDPAKIMIKGELLPARKAAIGKARIITVQSVVDNLVGQICHHLQNSAEKAHYTETPVKCGMGDNDVTHESIFSDISKMEHIASLDTSGFDFSQTTYDLYQRNLLRAERLHNAGLNVTPEYLHLLLAHEIVTADMLYVFDDGEAWAPLRKGGQKSGRDDTSNGNGATSLIRSYNAQLLAPVEQIPVPKSLVQGDDTSMRTVSGIDLPRVFKQSQINIRDLVSSTEKAQFCSHEYDKVSGTVTKTSYIKTIGNFVNKRPVSSQEAAVGCSQLASTLRLVNAGELRPYEYVLNACAQSQLSGIRIVVNDVKGITLAAREVALTGDPQGPVPLNC